MKRVKLLRIFIFVIALLCSILLLSSCFRAGNDQDDGSGQHPDNGGDEIQEELVYRGDEFLISVSGDNAAIMHYVGNEMDVIIPKYIEKDGNVYTVTSIGSDVFSGYWNFTSVTIPDSVTSIGDRAFQYCYDLTSVHITDISAWCNIYFGDDNINPLRYAGNLYLNGELVTNLVIPDGVTSIGMNAFEGCTSLTSVTIPDGVTSIGREAFSGCTSLMSVTIPDSVTSIGSFAFEDCTSLTSVTIPDSVISIGGDAFYGCTSLTSVTIPDSVISIRGDAFYGCTSLTSVTIPDSVISIRGDAFYGCTSLTSVHITDISAWCNISFGDWSANPLSYAHLYLNGELVTNLVIPDGVTSIGDSAFSGCTSLTSVTIPDSVTRIGDYSFSGCCKLVEVINKSSLDITAGSSSNGKVAYYAKEVHNEDSKVVKYNDYLFITSGGVNYLLGYVGNDSSIKLPESYNGQDYEIYKYAFYGCTSLTSVTIPDGVRSIGDSAFYECTNLKSVTIPNSVRSVGDNAFEHCYKLTSVTIPDSVTSIGGNAFSACYKLVEVINKSSLNITAGSILYGGIGYYAKVVHNGESKIVKYNDYLFITSGGVNYLFSYISDDTSLVLPESYNGQDYEICQYAFYGCTSLTSVTIPDSVTSIGDYALYECRNLKSVTIPDGVTSIGEEAFYGCRGLTSVTIPDSVTSIGEEAFSGCTSLTSVTIGDGVTSIGEEAFYGCKSLTSVHITDVSAWCNISFGGWSANPLYYAHNLYLNGELVTNLVIPDGVTRIGDNAFEHCYKLTSVTIGDGVTRIGDDAFRGCTSLTSVTIPDSVTSIGDYAFSNCTSLTSVTIGNSVTSIGTYAFVNCHQLVEVINKSSLDITAGSSSNGGVAYYAKEVHNEDSKVVKYNDYLFITVGEINYLLGYVGNDSSIKLPESYNGENYEIYQYAFSDCTSLTSVTIPDSVTSIGYRAFYDCRNLKSVTIGNSVTSIGDSAFDECINLKSVTIPNSVTSIGKSAFHGCINLKSVTIGNGVASIDDFAFSDCESLTSVYITDIAAWCNISFGDYAANPLSSAEKLYINGELVTNLIIPYGVTSIGYNTFLGCESLTSVTIPESVTSIGEDAFKYCYKLVEVINKSSLNITAGSSDYGYVGYYAKVVHNGESKIVKYNNYLFITSGGVNYLFSYIGDDTSLVLPESYNGQDYEICQYAFYGCTSLKSVTIPDGITSIASSVFSGCTSLKSVTFPDGVTSIGEEAFYGCRGLTSVTIPDSVTSIGYRAFYDCESLTSVTVPDGVTSIGKEAFDGCTSLTSVHITDISAWCNISFGYHANPLYYAGNLYLNGELVTNLVFPDSVTSIGSEAFSGCTSLTSVTMPDSVTSIGSHAFAYCGSFTSIEIKYLGTDAQWNAISKGYLWDYETSYTIIYNYVGE